MESEGPYKTEEFGELWTVRGPCGNMPFANEEDADFYRININAAYAEGRKEAESYTEKMIKLATDEVRKCHEEIRRLQDKYARNFYRMPLSLDEEFANKERGIND